MKKGLTEIGVVLDKSGSMGHIREDTIGGFNTFVEDQKKEPGDANITLFNFNDKVEKVYECENIKNVSKLTHKSYAPSGLTALYDGIGVMIDTLNADIECRDDKDKPEKVIIVIITDGFENASKEYNSKEIKEKIKDSESNNSWDFVYLGANQDAFNVGGEMGMPTCGTGKWNSTPNGSANMYRSVTQTMSNYRKTGVVNLKNNDKDKK